MTTYCLIWKIYQNTGCDLFRWVKILRGKTDYGIYDFVDIMTFFPEYRNVFYARVRCHNRILSHLLQWVAKPLPLLHIAAKKIGPGLYIQHGFATIVSPAKIGSNCWINQGVTIGYTNSTGCPTIGDDVTIGAGAKILGKCHIGNRTIIGANAVVVKDVPDDCVVVGGAARIVKQNGVKTDQKL